MFLYLQFLLCLANAFGLGCPVDMSEAERAAFASYSQGFAYEPSAFAFLGSIKKRAGVAHALVDKWVAAASALFLRVAAATSSSVVDVSVIVLRR